MSFNDIKGYAFNKNSALLHFRVSLAQDIGTSNSEMHHQRKKALVYQGLSANF
jgi:hypothetical protein